MEGAVPTMSEKGGSTDSFRGMIDRVLGEEAPFSDPNIQNIRVILLVTPNFTTSTAHKEGVRAVTGSRCSNTGRRYRPRPAVTPESRPLPLAGGLMRPASLWAVL